MNATIHILGEKWCDCISIRKRREKVLIEIVNNTFIFRLIVFYALLIFSFQDQDRQVDPDFQTRLELENLRRRS